MSEEPSKKRLSESISQLIERLVSTRYLRGLDEEQREQLRQDVAFINETLIDQRPPRIGVVGGRQTTMRELLQAIAGDAVEGDIDVKEYLGRGRWYDWEIRQTTLELLDLRCEPDEELSLKALEHQIPDLLVFAWNYGGETEAGKAASPQETQENRVIPDIARLEETVRQIQSISGKATPVVAVIDGAHLPEDVTVNRAERSLRVALRDSEVPNTQFRIVQRENVRDFDAELVELAPKEARLRLAQIVQTPGSKKRMARMIIRTCAGIAGTLATIPLPVADMVPITSVQVLMIAAIAHLSGRRLTVKTVGEFAAAIGVNVGAGYAVRELARALLQLIPFAGAVISSGIATGATFALGNAAVGYFIDGEFEVDLTNFDAAPERVQKPAWKRTLEDASA